VRQSEDRCAGLRRAVKRHSSTGVSIDVVRVGLADTADHCMQLVTDKRIRHLPVVDGDAVLGVVSIGDLVKAVIEDQQVEIDQLQRYIAS